jgi:hypothetical protein
MRPSPAFPIVVALAAALVGCSGSNATTTTPQDTPSSAQPDTEDAPGDGDRSAQPVRVPEELRFTADTVGGGRFVGEDHAGEDLALWFWAPW